MSARNAWASGLAIFAAVLMLTIGVLQILSAIAAIAEDEVYVKGVDYVYAFDLTTWGWIHLILGIGLVLAGWFVFSGAFWARAVGICVATVALIANFMWIPYYPWWSLIVIALCVAVMWALAVYDDPEVTP